MPEAGIQPDQVAVVAVVGGVVEDAVALVVRQRGDGVDHRPFEADDALDLAGLHVERADVGDHARVVEGGVDAVARLVVVSARHRAQRARGQVAMGRDRVLADGLEVLLLERLLGGDPVGPCAFQRPAEDVTELGGVVAAAARFARHPVQDLFGRVGARQPREESRAVEIRVDLELEVDLGALRHQARADRRRARCPSPSRGRPSRRSRPARGRCRRPATCPRRRRCLRGTSAARPPVAWSGRNRAPIRVARQAARPCRQTAA